MDHSNQSTDKPITPKRTRRKVLFGCLFQVSIVVLVILLLLPNVRRIRGAANRMKSSNNLKQIGLAIHNYHDDSGHLPGNSFSSDGKPLLSWRVHILPYLEQDELYKKFHLNEPWDSSHNIQLLPKIPNIYAFHPNNPPLPSEGLTHYLGFQHPGAIFEIRPFKAGKVSPLRFDLISKGLSETIAIVEAESTIEWTKPEDLDGSPEAVFPRLGFIENDRRDFTNFWLKNRGTVSHFQALFLDGTVRLFDRDEPSEKLRAWITYSGGEIKPLP